MQPFVHNRPKRMYFFAALLTVFVMGFGVNGWGQTTIVSHNGTLGQAGWTETNIDTGLIAGNNYLKLVKPTSTLVTPSMNFNSYNSCKLNFKARTFGGPTPAQATITVSISVNGGTTYTVIGTRVPMTTALTQQQEFDLSAYTGNAVFIKLQTLGAANSNGVGIDDIIVTGISNSGSAPVLIAGWDFQTKINGGTRIVSIPNTQNFYVANFGTGNIYLDGSNGSSPWLVNTSVATTELDAYKGTTENAGPGFAGVDTSGSLGLVSGRNISANNKSLVLKFSMSGRKNVIVSYATQRSDSGFTSQKWEYSTNGINWTTVQSVTSIPASFAADTLTTITGLDNAATAYLRLTFNGATAKGANNRLDNIQLTASYAPVITSQPGNAPAYCPGNTSTATFSVAAKGYPAPSYKWQYSKNNTVFRDVVNYLTAGFSYTNANTATLIVNTSGSATADSSYYRAVATNNVDSTFSNSALLTNGLPVAAVTVTPEDICSGDTAAVNITGTPNAVVNFRIKIDFATAEDHTGTLNSIGNYTYTFTPINSTPAPIYYNIIITSVVSPTNCTNTTNTSVSGKIFPIPTPNFKTHPSGQQCTNTTITYVTQPGKSKYLWTFTGVAGTDYMLVNGGTRTSDTAVVIWLTTGSKTASINYTNDNGCFGAKSDSATNTFKQSATITLTSGNSTQKVCKGNNIMPITYTVGGNGTGATVTNLPPGVTGSYDKTSKIYTISGASNAPATYAFTVTAIGGNSCTQQSFGSIKVNKLDTVYVSSANPNACNNTTAIVQVAGAIGDSITYTFTGVSGNQKAALTDDGNGLGVFNYTTPVLTTAQSPYTFTIQSVNNIKSNTGCASTVTNPSASITVYANPVVASISGGGAYIAVGKTTTLTDNTSGGEWLSDNVGIATVDKNAGIVTGVATGTDSIRYTVTGNGGCASSVAAPVYVYNPLTADYITKSGGNFSDNRNWKVYGGNNNYVDASDAPLSSNNNIIISNKITLDVDYTVGIGKTFLLNTTVLTDTFVVAPGRVFTVLGAANFNGKPVLLRSNKDSTAQIGGTVIISNATQVTAERYIALNTLSGSRTGRAWRLLSSPISNATIHDAWQEDTLTNTNLAPQNPAPGYGTNITGTKQGTAINANNNGYDFWPAIANTYSSIRSYSGTSAGGTWLDIPSIKGMKISAQPAYMLFVRGDRSKFSPPDAGSTTLRATGLLRQQDTAYTVHVPADQAYSLIGNPYAAVLNFDKILSDNSGLIKPQYWRWDANNGTYGGYTLVQKNNGSYYTIPYPFDGTNSALSNNAQYIASGQGFFVEPLTAGSGGFLSITRTDKATNGTTVSPFRVLPPASSPSHLFVNLNLYSADDSSSSLADGVMAAFDDNVNGENVNKPYNFNENLGLDKDTSILTVLSHPDEVKQTDTLHLRLWNTTARSYQIQVKAENWQTAGLQAYLLDNYLHTTSPLSLAGDVSTVTFAVSSDAASADQHRFAIVFSPTVLPVTITKVSAYKKSDGSVNIDWQTANEINIKTYTVERSFNGHDFTAVGSAAGSPSGSYSITDGKPGSNDNYYRIRIESAGGEITYSAVVKVSFSEVGGKMLITLFPNPLQEGTSANLKVENLPAGIYNTALYSAAGQRVHVSVIAHSGGSAVISYPMPHMLAQGRYMLRLFNSDDKQIATLPVVVVKK